MTSRYEVSYRILEDDSRAVVKYGSRPAAVQFAKTLLTVPTAFTDVELWAYTEYRQNLTEALYL